MLGDHTTCYNLIRILSINNPLIIKTGEFWDESWVVTELSDGIYSIKNESTGLAAQSEGLGRKLILAQENGSLAQEWIISPVGLLGYYICSAEDPIGCVTPPVNGPVILPKELGVSQLWRFIPAN
ncbi:hypothetical protein RCL_jg9792.t1 [Rhizophagus clarus]|uniref:Ricin B lectin domain-containing protein n=1 Tax=Rhizophagus clarus TaxID=94130 RepID=A0A8H3LYP3_9GLOM|nr:hypothetical protein RCL_jg9792.t1 [Rhizophagus clarus]